MTHPHDDTTKPSRINRRRKRKWRKASLNGLTRYRTLLDNHQASNTLVGFRSLKSIGVKTPNHGVFLCLKKIVADKIRDFYPVMVACSGQPKGWPAPMPGTANLLHVAAQQFAVVGGGYQSSALELPQ